MIVHVQKGMPTTEKVVNISSALYAGNVVLGDARYLLGVYRDTGRTAEVLSEIKSLMHNRGSAFIYVMPED